MEINREVQPWILLMLSIVEIEKYDVYRVLLPQGWDDL